MDIFSHLFVIKIVMCVWKDENKWKRGRGFSHFLKKNRYVTSDWLWTSSSFLYDHRSTIMLFKLADSVLRLVQTGRVKRSGIESFLTPCIFCKHKILDYPTVWTHANYASLNKPLSWHSFAHVPMESILCSMWNFILMVSIQGKTLIINWPPIR